MRRALSCSLWTLGGLALGLFAVKSFFLDVYLVDSASMAPWIHGSAEGGERVLVRYVRDYRPARFEAVVIVREGEPEPALKRVAGLPGEQVLLRGGDLVIDGTRLGPDAPRPAPVTVFDGALQRFDDAFAFDRARWQEEDAGWQVDARDLEEGSEAGLACYHPRILDGYVDRAGRRAAGTRAVNDLVLESRFRVEPSESSGAPARSRGALIWRLSEEAEVFEAEIRLGDESTPFASLRRRSASGEAVVLDESEVPVFAAFDPGAWHAVRFSNVDDVLTLEVDGAVACRAPTAGARASLATDGEPGRHRMPRACLGAQGLRAQFRDVRIARDLYYTESGRYGVGQPLQLGPREIFVLGDNSAESRDSREWGPIRLEEVVGVPVAVLWPPSAMRWL